MNNTYRQYLELIRGTRRFQTEVLEAAGKMAEIESDLAAKLARELIGNGEDSALGILANVCSLRQIRLTPDLLPAVLEVIEPITDFGPLLRSQDREAIPFLLDAAASEAVSFQRQAYAALLAAEMTVFHGADLRPVRRTLRILEQEYYIGPEVEALLASAAALIDLPAEERTGQDLLFQASALDLLPENPPPMVIGDGGTVRRPIPKIGRNAPCPCGSGEKYKKCCMEKDQLQIRDASSYEGLTKGQVLASPDLVNDTAMIREMRSYALKKLDPARLNVAQLFAAGKRCELFGLRELAFQMLLEIESREGKPLPPTAGYFDLMRAALDACDLDLAERIGEHIPWQNSYPGSEVLRLHWETLRHGDLLKRLEERFSREFTAAQKPIGDLLLLRLSCGLERMFPALSLIFARAFISGYPDRFFDIDSLLTTVRRARAALDMEPWDDPIEDYAEWFIKRDMADTRQKDQSEELRALGDKLDTARAEVRQRQQELRQKEEQLSAMAEKLEMRPSIPHPEAERAPQTSNAEDTQTIARLRGRIDALKAEIGSHQQIRRDLRRELHEERKKTLQRVPAPSGPEQERLMDTGLVPPATIKKILIPEFMPAFQQACAAMPTVHAAKALKAVAGFSTGDEIVWRHTKPIKRISGCFRIRIGKDYRLLLNWKPDETLQVLDCIHRSNLEAWIRGRITA